ncbi:MAG: protein-methionine-sulfoxide reductase catalytic subunit MsrP [Notoacmeibacter sp.]|nr:protein-methionine-sulfoxide reductase catalytic subunit MsrP [Notoacmeibacter sp.]
MPAIHRRPAWAIAEAAATPEAAFLNRRRLLAGMGLGTLSMAAASAWPRRALSDEAPGASYYPAKQNGTYTIDRELTPEDVASTYNNFYEFGSHKTISSAAQALKTSPWDIAIDGMVEKPFTIGFEDLLKKVTLEERLYRHRCVEAWSMTVPWTGFPMSALLGLSKPLASAKYVRLETFMDPATASGQQASWYPWPYVEGLTMAEAANDLAFMVTGIYGKPLAKQFGAPIRLALPWKYGFKSIKSITRISFTAERPKSFWEQIAPTEYGFWANVNPGVPHPRWRQDQERVLHTGLYTKTLMFNGYGDQVAGLYVGLDGEKLYM